MPKSNKKYKVFQELMKIEGTTISDYYRIMKLAGLTNKQILEAIEKFKVDTH